MTSTAPKDLRTIPDVLAYHAGKRPEATAMIDPQGKVLTYFELEAETRALGAALASCAPRGGAEKRFGIVMPNGIDISVTLLAACSQGIAVPFNPAQTTPEFVAQFTATTLDAVILLQDGNDAAAPAAHSLSLPILSLTPERNVAGYGPPKRAQHRPLPDDLALVLMTSGSTGQPKIVPLSHRNLSRSAQDVATSLGLTNGDRCLLMWEQFHIGGLVDLLLAPLVAGGSVIVAGSFDAVRFFDLQEAHKATWFQAVPTSLNALLHEATRRQISAPLPDLRLLRSVAAGLPQDVLKHLIAQFQVPVVRTLGMTEASPLITSTQPLLPETKPKSVGRSAGPQICILNAENQPLPQGKAGQVAIMGENVFTGYEGNASANAQAFVDGWFLTGDLGYFDVDGDLFLTGRAKEMINRGGEKINPSEVEDALRAFLDIAEAACFALPHGTLGEDIAGAVSSVEGTDIDMGVLRGFLAERLAKHKIPARIEQFKTLPRTPVGKIDKPTLVAKATEAQSAAPTFHGAPFTPLQTLVADIWKKELSLVHVGLDDDFASVDGDSLSAVRILVALETVLDSPLPNDIVENFATIREIASGLEAHGFETLKTQTPAGDAKTNEALAEQIIFSGDADAARTLIQEASGHADVRLKLDYLVAHLPPVQVAQVLSLLDGVIPGDRNPQAGKVDRFRMRRELSTRRAELQKYLPSNISAEGWHRQIMAPGALLFSAPGTDTKDKTLIVAFSGNRMRLLMPAFRFLAEIDPERADVLLLMDHNQKLFFEGLAGMGTNLPALTTHISIYCSDQGYRRMVALGTSGGSLAALHAGIAGNFDAAVAVAPASLAKHPEWIPAFEALTSQYDPDRHDVSLVHGRRERHKKNADEIAHYLPFAAQVRYPHASKNIFAQAQERGELGALLQAWLSL